MHKNHAKQSNILGFVHIYAERKTHQNAPQNATNHILHTCTRCFNGHFTGQPGLGLSPYDSQSLTSVPCAFSQDRPKLFIPHFCLYPAIAT